MTNENDLIGKKIRTRHGVWTVLERHDNGEYLANFYDDRNDRKCVVTKDAIDGWIDVWGVDES